MKQADLKYRTTWIATIVVMVFTIVSSLSLRVALSLENRRRDKEALLAPRMRPEPTSEKGSDALDGQNSIIEGIMHVDRDLTDWEDTSFRYSL